jgi:hypothetical protein
VGLNARDEWLAGSRLESRAIPSDQPQDCTLARLPVTEIIEFLNHESRLSKSLFERMKHFDFEVAVVLSQLPAQLFDCHETSTVPSPKMYWSMPRVFKHGRPGVRARARMSA